MSDATDPQLDRYNRASISQRALQSERGEIGSADDLTAAELAELDKVEVALELAGVELDAARTAYLNESGQLAESGELAEPLDT
jgi:hypothetical protein